jgi:hypothetical protein
MYIELVSLLILLYTQYIRVEDIVRCIHNLLNSNFTNSFIAGCCVECPL